MLAGATGVVPRRIGPTDVLIGVIGEVRLRAAGGGTRVVPTVPVEMLGICVVAVLGIFVVPIEGI